ncbi:flagellin [Labrenzia sp. PHM005]|uniref:flagellin N-terminal helical domain-containing protein n=1 Tax=Labrenzia sp. PHM005 TaxID=2590016 RepID=UPI00113FCD16|nr:flagellin [Labrenzia sp. PHM005]QDG76804.1 ABC transporter substrate-binding protein [Labrenzia sp. PHM005]
MRDIALSAGVRQNLLTLQSTADLMSGVQNKLATGLKVNSALDNPNSFFTASGLNARAGDLGTLLDDMGQSLQTIKAADKGISTITDLVEAAKAKANQAQQTQSQSERAAYAKQYNDLLEQIEDVAKDSSYKGKNLLAGEGNDLTTIFNEDATSKQTITAVDYTDAALSTGLNLSDLDEAKGGAASFDVTGGNHSFTLTDAGGDALGSGSLITDASGFNDTDTISIEDTASGAGAALASVTISTTTTVGDVIDEFNKIAGVKAEFDDKTGTFTVTSNTTAYLHNDNNGSVAAAADFGTATAAVLDSATAKLTDSGSFQVGDTLELTDGNGYEIGSFEVSKDSTIKDLVDFLDDSQGVEASFNTGTNNITIESDVTIALKSDNTDFNASAFTADSDGINVTAALESGFASDNDISKVVDRLNNALSSLRSQASEFGTNLSTVEIRQDYTKSMINTLQEGAGKLTLADTNEEGANLLALQTRQQLASTSLSFASQADQTVLSLF